VSSFAVLGEALIDLRVVAGAEPAQHDRPAARGYTAQPGGSPFNVAIGLARLGHRAEFVGRIATDALGGILRRHAQQSGVSLRWSGQWPGPTPAALFDLNEDGSARYEFHLAEARESSPAPTGLDAVHAVHFGSIASWLPGSAEAVLESVARLRETGALVSYDPNIRAMLATDRAQVLRYIDRAVDRSDLIKASVEDLAWTHPGLDPADLARGWLERGALAVVVTHGSDGADCYTASGKLHGSSAPVEVVDTIGAGDAFMAGLLEGLAAADSLSRDGLAALPARTADMQQLLDDACAYAAATCTVPGADPPWRALVTLD
jgi:fructokinase